MFNFQLPNLGALVIVLVLWEAFWKMTGLWKAAKKGDTIWFIAIFAINLVGIIPIIYLWRTKQLSPVIEDVRHFFASRFQKK